MEITKRHWMNVCMDLKGLRSEDNPTEIKSAASYAMDCGITWSPGQAPPENWISLLKGLLNLALDSLAKGL